MVKALLIEDFEEDRLKFKRIVRQLNEDSSFLSLDYEECFDLKTALELIKNDSYDVILLDLSLPDTVDIEALEKVHEYCERTAPIIVLTGREDESFALQVIKNGAYDYVKKRELNPYVLGRSIIYALERFKMAIELDELRVQQAKSLKMATLGEMSGNIAHEINNPLSIIMGYADKIKRLNDGDQCDENYALFAEKILLTTQRVAKIVKSLKSYSRREDEDPMLPTPFISILEDSLNLCQEKLNKAAIDLIIDRIPDVKLLCKDVQLSQVLLNLIGNAHDAVGSLEEKWISLRFEELTECLNIYITDSGVISNEIVKKKIFSPFFTTKEKGVGTGLGMSISKNIINSHGGTIELVDNAENTCFKISLPIIEAA